MRRRLSMVVALGLRLASASGAGSVTCHSYTDAELQRLVTTCSDGSRGVTRDDEELQRWNTTIITPAPGTARGLTGTPQAGTRDPAVGRDMRE